jgi:hypothetical protein
MGKEPILIVNPEELQKALENSKNPELLKEQTKILIENINKQSDEYLSL